MAAAQLKRGEAVVWLPPRSDGERAFGSEPRLLAIRGGEGGARPLERVSLDGLEGVSQVRLVFDPRDVTLLAPEVPALTGARLAQALPNIVEDSLLQDVATCAIVAGPALQDGRRLVAAIDREWLEFTVGAFERRGIRVRAAMPAQLALPWAPPDWSIACVHGALALRHGPHLGLGWYAGEDQDFRTEALVAMLETALVGRDRPAALAAWVDDASWQLPLQRAAARLDLRVRIAALPAVASAPIELLAGRAAVGRRMLAAFDPRAWRLPAALVAACVIASIAGLNLHWAQLARERDALRRALEGTFRATFPQAQVVVDPLLQMNRQVATLRARSGQQGPEDFVPMMSRLSQALGPNGADALAGVEFREGRLKVRFQPQRVDGRAAREQLRDACARAGLRLQFDNEREPTATVALQS
ncbi:MAG TPA: type II secretion system protein GspL [Burkholderiaceae bacterium]|nr:type II secretion system protein GspL [Burkholderiaceae bacterium]